MSVVSFCFESTQVRTLGDSFNPLFVALDICKALGFQDAVNAVKRHVDPEDLSKEEITDSMNRKQLVNCVNESGMYALIFGSKLPSAKRFKKWVTSEVLPTIRKTGQYSTAEQSSEVPTLTPAQQLLVRQAVASRAKIESKNYQTIYRAIYNRFQIARYDQLPQTDLNECLKFIQEVNLSVPEMPHNTTPDVQGQVLLLTSEDCERLRNFIYAFKYLFRKEVEMFYEFLYRVKSPYAGKFYDATTDWSLTNVERILEKCGYPVKELDCYKHWSSHN